MKKLLDYNTELTNDDRCEIHDQIEALRATLARTIETAKFYQNCSGDKKTLKFGYSRVVSETSKVIV